MKANLEADLLKTEWIREKCKTRNSYAQNLYAALCNNRFFKNDEEWTCSWRYAGRLIANMVGFGDYMDYYCSAALSDNKDYVPEGYVTSEISNDILNLGWVIKPYEPKLKPGLYRNEW